jgi:chromosome segregation ATPase
MSVEKEKTNSTVEQLKEGLTSREADLNGMKKELTKAQNHMKNLERVKSELEAESSTLVIKLEAASRDKTESNRHFEEVLDQLSQSKAQAAKLESELAEFKLKLEAETDRRDEAEAQWRNAKKLLEESEAQLGMTKQEEERLSMKLSEVEERFGAREGQFMQMADENKQREKKLLEEKHNLNVSLLGVQQQMEQLSVSRPSLYLYFVFFCICTFDLLVI